MANSFKSYSFFCVSILCLAICCARGAYADAGQVRSGWIGVAHDDAAPASRTLGAYISGVIPDGMAARAGIKAGDVIIAFDGKMVTSWQELPPLIAATVPGKPWM
jgi:S1-C subfamily serine protease